ncbi:hypothetical protein G9A89_006110 [Geosiphon pyriformis]|nr:hypothetical protein G9A89_006110 [Geosiphon pyriformis]
MELAIPLISPAVQIIGDNLKINSVIGETTQQNNFKVVITPDTTTLEYYQSIYTYCKQRFNIPDGIEIVKKSTAANEKNNSEISEEESIDNENEEDEMTAYIAKIPEFNGEDIETSPQEWLDQVTKTGDANGWNAARIINSNNQLVLRNPAQPRPIHYYTQPSYLTIPEKQDFHQTALSEGRAAARQQNPSYTPTTILPARIAENANLSDIFPFEFEANESPFLLSNVATNEQKAITAMYTEAKVKGKAICLILDSRSAGSIITYQLMQQLKRNVDRLAQTVIITADGIKKTPVGEIDNFPFTLDGITIPVKVLVMDAPQYQALVGNDWLQKANANLNWETQELTISYQGQHAWVSATCGTFNKHSEKAPAFEFELEEEKPIIETFMALGSTSNWANKTEQQYFSTNDSLETKEPVTTGWNMIFDLAMALIKGATKEDVHQMKEAEYIEYTMELARFDYKNEIEVYHQIASHTYSTQEAQIQ